MLKAGCKSMPHSISLETGFRHIPAQDILILLKQGTCKYPSFSAMQFVVN